MRITAGVKGSRHAADYIQWEVCERHVEHSDGEDEPNKWRSTRLLLSYRPVFRPGELRWACDAGEGGGEEGQKNAGKYHSREDASVGGIIMADADFFFFLL